MSKSNDRAINPNSIRQKQILDVAADEPDASLGEIAEEVPSATTDLVENVLEEYGDPADTDATPEDAVQNPTSEEPSHPDPSALTPKQRTTLRAIYDRPDATQRELADLLDVSAATVSNRVNAIDGFDWDDRRQFAVAVFGDESPPGAAAETEADAATDLDETTAVADGEGAGVTDAEGDDVPDGGTAAATEARDATTDDQIAATGDRPAGGGQPSTAGEAPESTTDRTNGSSVDQLSERLTTVEEQLTDVERALAADADSDADSAFTDPELVHKIVHACVQSEAISEDEELRILRELLSGP